MAKERPNAATKSRSARFSRVLWGRLHVQIEMWDIDRIREYQGNPRLNDDAVDRVAESIRQFGFKVPVLVDQDGVLIAGHTRIRAARRLGMKQVPVIRADDLTPEQVRALRIADNKLHELSTWDMQLLPIELEALQAMNFDLDILGFSKTSWLRFSILVSKRG